MRGEYSCPSIPSVTFLGSPPHARGILCICDKAHLSIGITPACAGNTTVETRCSCPRRDHPRMRGEYQLQAVYNRLRPGSPPHARGILRPLCANIHFLGITPACAGNTIRKATYALGIWDHPRMRGEYFNIFEAMTVVGGSPPHARGIQNWKPLEVWTLGITPACAGNT